MTTTIKITQLSDIGANLTGSTILPVVNMTGTPVTQKTSVSNMANVILSGAGTDYAEAGVAGTVSGNIQPNITSVGTLIGLTVSNSLATVNLINTSNVSLGAAGRVHITGGANGQVLTTNGLGNLVWANATGIANTGNITFNDDVIASTNDIVNIVGNNYAQLESANTYIWVEDGEADIEVNGNRWIFNDSGYMQIPNDGLFGAVNSSILALSSQNNKPIFIEVVDTGSSEARQWIFDNAGNLTLPDGTVIQNGGGIEYPTSPGYEWDLHSSDGNVYIGSVEDMAYIDTYSPDIGVRLRSNENDWIFGPDGNLTLPSNTFAVNYANGTQVPLGGGGNANTGNVTFDNINVIGTGNLHLQPDPANSGSYLDIFLTSGPDLHLVASAAANLILGKDNQANIMTSWNGNAYVQSWDSNTNTQGGVWTFGGDGALTLPNNANIATIGNVTQFNTCTNGFLSLNSYDAGGNNIASLAVNSIDGLVGISTHDTATDSDYQWGFNITGGTIFPTLTVDLHNGGNQTAQTLQFGDPTQQAIITGPTPAVNDNAQRIIIQGQRGTGTGEGGDVYVWGGDSDVNGGDIKIYAGDAEVSGYGGYINIDGGTGIDGGGGLSLTGGQSANGQGGQITITPGYSGNANGATLSLNGGQAAGNGGGVDITAGAGTANGGQVTITGGQSALGLPGYGNVVVSSGASQWKFDNTGNLVLPGNTFAVNYANGTQAQFSQISKGNSNVSVPTSSDNVYINVNSGSSKQWIFDTAGNLRTPGNVDIYGAINFPQQVSSLNWSTYNIELSQYGRINTNVDFFANANVIGAQYLKGDGSNITNISTPRIANGTSNVNIPTSNGNVVITANGTANWTFDTTGNLTLPGNLIGPTSANFTIYSNAAVHEFIFADDGTFYAPDNVVLGGNSIYIGPGANTLAGTEHAVMIASSDHFAYIQAVINNVSDNGSADWVALGHYGNDAGGATDMGFTSSGFGDANYTITGGGDGYLFVQGYLSGQAPADGGGNLVLATSQNGTTKDIIFGTGGFLTANIFGRISDANNSFELSRTGATITFPDATEQNTAWTGSVATVANGNSNVRVATSDGNVTVTSSGTNSWIFDTTGNLTIPGTSGGFIKTVSNASIGVAAIDNGTNNPAQLLSINAGSGAATSIVSAYSTNATIQTNATGTLNTWSFDNAGNLTLPTGGQIIVSGGLISSGASPAPTFSGFNITNHVGVTGTGNISGNNISVTGNVTGNTNGFTIGYLNIPQVAAANATLALTDAGKHYYSTTAGNFTLTVPNNTSTAFATGTAISIVVQAAGNILVNAASGVTLYMAGNSTAANRVVGGYGMATLMKVGTDTWFINGTGVS